MLRRLRQLENWDVRSNEGDELGKIVDFYFDDERWTVRYVVVGTGSWFAGRSALLSPISLDRVNDDKACLEFNLTSNQIASAPNAEVTLPISRQWEASHCRYYGFPYYWEGPRAWGFGATPLDVRSSIDRSKKSDPLVDAQHIHSANEVAGYQDGESGHVEDFLVDDQTWTIRYLLVNTRHWIGGRTVLIAPQGAGDINWAHSRVRVDVDRESVKSSPQYEPAADISHRPVRKV
jgi:hypothetical protein